MKFDPFIYGKDQTEGVTSIEIEDAIATIYRGPNPHKFVMNEFYILYADNYTGNLVRLAGNLHYCWAQKFLNSKEYQKALGIAKGKGWDHYTIYNPKESFMVKTGVTYYKGLEPKDVSILSFDIETTGLDPATCSLLLISNTFRSHTGVISRCLFCIDDYKTEKEMIYAWASYVNDCDPSIMVGHNVFGFDLQFIQRRLGKSPLPIGKMQSPAKFASNPSEFRKDGSQTYRYYNVLVPGREVVDTFHLSIKYDTGRNYPSYRLKEIIKAEGLEKPDRQHYNAMNIAKDYKDPVKWEQIKKYAEHDADDALALFDLMIPAYFYYCQSIPKTLQQIVNSASGAQINSFMVRSYLAEKHSLPKASEAIPYEGGISFGKPGIYEHVNKVDVASLYPSIMLEYKVYDKYKDPKANFLKMVEYFTKERLENKAKFKSTSERKYKDLSEAQKIIINSAYGFMGASGLLFNSPANAALVTKRGRSILQTGINWTESLGFTIVNADTDSFSFTNNREMDHIAFKGYIKALNILFPPNIKWEDDGQYSKCIIVKAKNYILKDKKAGKVSIKGSALKASMKEPALKDFTNDIISIMLSGIDSYKELYVYYVNDIYNIDVQSIARWSSKKTITKSVLNPKRTNESRIKDAISAAGKTVQEGDKINVFFRNNNEIALVESFDGEYDRKKLLGKLHKTAEIFETVLPMEHFPNLTLKKNEKLLKEILEMKEVVKRPVPAKGKVSQDRPKELIV